MPNAASHSTRSRLRNELERLIGQFDASVPQSFTQAMQSFLTAIDYEDIALMRSHLNAALESLRQVVHEAVQKRLGWPQQAREACRNIWDIMKGCPNENWDEIGEEIGVRFDGMLRILTDLRDGSVRLLQEHGCEIENAALLDADIKELKELKKSVLSNWPWSDQELPPVDRKMVAESRDAIGRNEGEPVEDLIRRLGGNLPKGG